MALSGGGSIGVAPLEFLSGLVWAETTEEFGGLYFSGWTFTFETAVDIDYSAGTIDVDVGDSPLLQGGGKVSGLQYGIETVMNNSATGTIDVVNGTWSLEYGEFVSGWTTEFHLEGTLAAP